jgi:cytochrome c oxidase cbb3-type subunit IV
VDEGTVRGLWTLGVMLAFLGVVFWAYGRRRKADFDEAAQLPFREQGSRREGAESDDE